MRNEPNEKQRRFKLPAERPETEASGSAALRRKRMSNNCGCLQRILLPDVPRSLGGVSLSSRRTQEPLKTQLDCCVTCSAACEHLANKLPPQSVKRQLFSNAFSGQRRGQLALINSRDLHMTDVSAAVHGGGDTGGTLFSSRFANMFGCRNWEVQLTFADIANRNAANYK